MGFFYLFLDDHGMKVRIKNYFVPRRRTFAKKNCKKVDATKLYAYFCRKFSCLWQHYLNTTIWSLTR